MKVKVKLPTEQLKQRLQKSTDAAVDKALKKVADDLRRQACASLDRCIAAYHASDPWEPPK
jgi:uncharacterized phage-associated protein